MKKELAWCGRELDKFTFYRTIRIMIEHESLPNEKSSDAGPDAEAKVRELAQFLYHNKDVVRSYIAQTEGEQDDNAGVAAKQSPSVPSSSVQPQHPQRTLRGKPKPNQNKQHGQRGQGDEQQQGSTTSSGRGNLVLRPSQNKRRGKKRSRT